MKHNKLILAIVPAMLTLVGLTAVMAAHGSVIHPVLAWWSAQGNNWWDPGAWTGNNLVNGVNGLNGLNGFNGWNNWGWNNWWNPWWCRPWW